MLVPEFVKALKSPEDRLVAGCHRCGHDSDRSVPSFCGWWFFTSRHRPRCNRWHRCLDGTGGSCPPPRSNSCRVLTSSPPGLLRFSSSLASMLGQENRRFFLWVPSPLAAVTAFVQMRETWF